MFEIADWVMNKEGKTDKHPNKNDLFRRWLEFQAGLLGSKKAVADRIKKHPNTISRLIHSSRNVSRETIESFRKAFQISERDYLLGPERYREKMNEMPLDPDRVTQVYPLRFLRYPVQETARSWSVWSHQHQNNYRDYVHIYVDVDGRGFETGAEVVVNIRKRPRVGEIVLLWGGDEMQEAYFTKWTHYLDDHFNGKIIGTVEYAISP